MSPTPVSTDKLVFQELQFTFGGTTHFAWYQSDTAIATQTALGVENVGPRWALWTEPAVGRIPIYRYRRQMSATDFRIDHAFKTTNAWVQEGYVLDNAGDPVGYGTTRDDAAADSAVVYECSGTPERYAYTQWIPELESYQRNAGMVSNGAAFYSPMMCVVEAKYDAATGVLALTSNDPNPTRAAAGEVNVYRGQGTPVRFVNLGAGEFPQSGALAVTYKGGTQDGQNAIGAGLPFEPSSVGFPNSLWLIANDAQESGDQEFEYSVTVVVEGEAFTHDPKIIQRKTVLLD